MTREETIQSLIAKGYESDGKGGYRKAHVPRSRTFVQELKDDLSRRPHHGSAKAKDHGPIHRRIAVSMAFFVSDRRRRDIDGMTSTILDCLVHAGVISDDNRFVVPVQSQSAEDCPKGEERSEITIEVLEK